MDTVKQHYVHNYIMLTGQATMPAINVTSNVNITTRITTTNFMCKKKGDKGGEQHVRSNVAINLVGLYLFTSI